MRLIDLDSFPMLPNKLEGDYTEYERGYIDAQSNMFSLPTIDAVEVVWHWVKPTVIDGRAFNIPHCSVCNGVPCGVDEHTNYCPNCGAKMDGEATE